MRSVTLLPLLGIFVLTTGCDVFSPTTPPPPPAGLPKQQSTTQTEPGSHQRVSISLEANPLVVKIPGTVTLIGHVTLEDGGDTNPVTDGTVVSLLDADGIVSHTAKTKDGEVTFRFVLVSVGEYQFSASSLGVASGTIVVEAVFSGSPKLTLNSGIQPYIKVNGDASTGSALLAATLIDGDSVPMQGKWVSFTTDLGSLSDVSAATNVAGHASVTLMAGTVPGNAHVTASMGAVSDTVSVLVVPGPPAEIRFESAPAGFGVINGDAFNQAEVVFSVRDSYGNLVTDAEPVAFQLNPAVSGVSVSASDIAANGLVAAQLQRNAGSGGFRVKATAASFAPVTTSSLVYSWDAIAADRFGILISGRKVLSGMLQAGVTSAVNVFVSDRFGNPAAVGSLVQFQCAASLCLPGTTALSTYAGKATLAVTTTGDLPVSFGTGAKVSFYWIGENHLYPALGDPRNGYVTVFAAAVGESGYNDINGNGFFDAGFDSVTNDPSEPFLDVNSDGIRNAGESFVDYDANTLWDSHAIASYHARQLVWDDVTLIYSGEPAIQIVPARFVDVNADGLFDPDSDLAVVGGPFPAVFPFASPATDNTYGMVDTAQTEIFVNFSDINNNPFPSGTTMYVWDDSPLTTVSFAPNAAKYQGEYFFPKPPVVVTLSDAEPGRVDGTNIQICARVTLGDIGTTFTKCIDGYLY